MQPRKTTQPSIRWPKPSACSIPQALTSSPTSAMRNEFISTAIGTAESSSTALCQVGPR